jgi:hypothetical protein
LVVLAIAGRPLATDDTWWHLAMGRLYASGDLWPRADPLLHTTVLRPPVAHEWLFQVAILRTQEMLGFAGLRALHLGALLALLGSTFGVFRRSAGDLAAASLATVVFLVLCWFRLVQLRPEVFSALAIVVLYASVLRPEIGPSRSRIFLALGLFLVWVNAHSLFAIGLCLLLAALGGTALRAILGRIAREAAPDSAANASRARRLALAFAGSLAVTLLNPRGFDQHLTFFTESRAGLIWKIRDDFLPWQPFALPSEPGPIFTPLAWGLIDGLYALVISCAVWRLWRFARTRSTEAAEALDPVHLGLALAAGVASLVSVRFHWLSLFPLLYLLRQWRAWTPAPGAVRAALALASIVLVLATPRVANFASYASELAFERDGYRGAWMDDRYCGPGMRFLRDARLEGRLYHPFNLGGFLGYWLAPGMRTFIDGRLDHVPAEVLDDYLAIRRASRTGPTHVLRERLDRWGVDVFFADSFAPERYDRRISGTHLRRLPEWIPIHASRSCVVYLRRNPHNRPNLERTIAYYVRRGVPFDPDRGLRVGRALARAPEWAEAQRLRHPDHANLEVLVARGGETERAFALDQLAAHAWRIGDFEGQIPLDRELLRLRPRERTPGVRLADALIQRGRVRSALPVLEAVLHAHPGDPEARYLERRAKRRVEESAESAPGGEEIE